jgi:hypothetical protein
LEKFNQRTLQSNKTFYNFVTDELIQQCSVKLGGKISSHENELQAPRNWKKSTCVYCSDIIPNLSQLVKHVTIAHSDIQTFRCCHCKTYFKNKADRKRHKDRSHLYHCVYCSKRNTYRQSANLRRHIKLEHKGEKIIQCDLNNSCQQYFRTEQDKLEHIQLHHSPKRSKERVNCNFCKFNFSSMPALKKHLLTYHAGQFFQCGRVIANRRCLRVFLTIDAKREHILKKHGSDIIIKCEFCQKTFLKNHNNYHMTNHCKKDGIKRCRYKQCATFFRTEEDKQKHEEQIHGADYKIKCIFCSLLLSNKKSYENHLINIHKSQLPNAYKCTYDCYRYFLTEADRDEHDLNEHIKPNASNTKCCYCSKFFAKKRGLSDHIKSMHADVQIHQCIFQNSCAQYFQTKSELDEHLQHHHENQEQNKEFQCSECNLIFNQKCALSRHFNLLHRIKKTPMSKVSEIIPIIL